MEAAIEGDMLDVWRVYTYALHACEKASLRDHTRTRVPTRLLIYFDVYDLK
jgi:hypothetical protein